MSLHFTLKVNGHSIYHAMDITRLDPTDVPDPDSTYRYRANAVSEKVPDSGVFGSGDIHRFEAVVEHRYGDGAWELIRKALNAMLDEVAS